MLVIGGGGAGVTAAISASTEGAQVLVVNQGPVARTGLTMMLGGGISVVGGQKDPRDSVDLHFRDMVERGYYLGDQNLVEALTREAPERVLDLERYGAKLLPLNWYTGKNVEPGQSYGHTFSRGYYLLGSSMMKVLRKELLRRPEITLLEDHFIFTLLSSKDGITGALGLDMRSGQYVVIRSAAVILATGGAGEVFSFTTNAPQKISGHARGTGYALALRAGAKLVDMEMTQFYPATPVWPPAIWGIHVGVLEDIVSNAGAKILNARGEEFLQKPFVRDVTARRIHQEIKEGRGTRAGGVVVDITKSPMPAEEYSRVIRDGVPAYKQYKNLGVDITKEPFEAAPSFHFQVGGVWINERGESSVPGLFAAGEVSGNTHGANRLAGDAVPELLVFGTRAGQNAAKRSFKEKALEPERQQIEQEVEKVERLFQTKKDSIRPHEILSRLSDTMYAHVGVSRNARGITKAAEEIEQLANALGRIHVCDSKIYNLGLIEAKEVELMIDTAKAIAASALIRQESRGVHFREDYPVTDYTNWTKHVVLEQADEKLKSTLEPVVLTKLKPPKGD